MFSALSSLNMQSAANYRVYLSKYVFIVVIVLNVVWIIIIFAQIPYKWLHNIWVSKTRSCVFTQLHLVPTVNCSLLIQKKTLQNIFPYWQIFLWIKQIYVLIPRNWVIYVSHRSVITMATSGASSRMLSEWHSGCESHRIWKKKMIKPTNLEEIIFILLIFLLSREEIHFTTCQNTSYILSRSNVRPAGRRRWRTRKN